MLVKDVMSTNADYLAPEATLRQAAQEMASHDFGFLPVAEEGKFLGVITDRDMVIRGIAKGLNPDETKLSDVLTHDFFSIFEDEDLKQAAESMEEHQIRRLVVLDRDNHITGILSLSDICNNCRDEDLQWEIDQKVYEKAA